MGWDQVRCSSGAAAHVGLRVEVVIGKQRVVEVTHEVLLFEGLHLVGRMGVPVIGWRRFSQKASRAQRTFSRYTVFTPERTDSNAAASNWGRRRRPKTIVHCRSTEHRRVMCVL